MPGDKTVGDSGSCDQSSGWCMYVWDQGDQKFSVIPGEGGCETGFECPSIDPVAYGGSAELNTYDEFRAIVCCEASSSGSN